MSEDGIWKMQGTYVKKVAPAEAMPEKNDKSVENSAGLCLRNEPGTYLRA